MPPLTLDLSQATAILRASGVGARPVSVTRLSGGQEGGAHRVRLADGSSLVIKVYAPEDDWMAAKEIAVYRTLREHGITTIPATLGRVLAGESPIGRPALVMTTVAGDPINEVLVDASADQVASVYRQLGAILRQVHAIDQEAFAFIGDAGLDEAAPTNEEFVRTLFGKRTATFLERGGEESVFAAATGYFAANAHLLAACARPVLLHNDCHGDNFLARPTAHGPVVTGFVDVENAIAGDPVADLERLDYYDIRGDRHRLRALFEGYGSTPAHWAQRRRLYRLVHHFELWVWFDLIDQRDRLPELITDIRAIVSG